MREEEGANKGERDVMRERGKKKKKREVRKVREATISFSPP